MPRNMRHSNETPLMDKVHEMMFSQKLAGRSISDDERDVFMSGVGICVHCELLVRWVEVPNGRGDPTLGIVDHTYRIVSRKTGRSFRKIADCLPP